MIHLSKEDPNRAISLEKQLEKLYEMKTVLASNSSTINLDYALSQVCNQIKQLEEKIQERDMINSIKSDTETFDTEKYAEKAKNKK